MKRVLLFLAALNAFAQTVYLRTGTPGGYVRVTGAVTQGSYIRLTLLSDPSLSVGELVRVDGLIGCSNANGTRYVAGVPSGTTVDLLDRNQNPLSCNGAFSDATNYRARLGKTASHSLVGHPRVLLDGPSGLLTTRVTNNDTPGWPPWDGLKARADACLSSTELGHPGCASACALAWKATGTASYLTCAKDRINQAELFQETFGADPSRTHGGRGTTIADFGSMDQAFWAIAYSLVEAQLTAQEKSDFAAKMLNDRIDGCTNQLGASDLTGTVTTSGTSVTGSGGADFVAAGFQAGDWLHVVINSQNSEQIKIQSVDSTTTMTLVKASAGYTNAAYRRAVPWTTSHCGAAWAVKFHANSILANSTDYGLQSGSFKPGYSNLAGTKARGFALLGLALADDDRGKELLEGSYAWLFDEFLPYSNSFWSGLHSGGTGQYKRRMPGYPMAALLSTYLAGGPDNITDKLWHSRWLEWVLHAHIPARPADSPRWGDTAGANMLAQDMDTEWMAVFLARTTDTGKRFNHWLRNKWPYWQQTGFDSFYGGQYAYIFLDPGDTLTDYTTLATMQYKFQDTADGLSTVYSGGFLSRSSWGSNDTSWLWGEWGQGGHDHHINSQGGTYDIGVKDAHFTGHDHPTNIAQCVSSLGQSCYKLGGVSEWYRGNVLWIGAAEPSAPERGYCRQTIVDYGVSTAYMSRWAGANPTGRTDNKYAYALFTGLNNNYAYGLARSYDPGNPVVNRGDRHLLHLKAGAQDLIVAYDDYALTNATDVPMGQWFYLNNGQAGEGTTTLSVDTVTSTYLASAQLLSKIILPSANLRAVLANGGGGTPGSKWLKWCVDADTSGACDTAQAAEYLIVHQPCPNQSCAMPATAPIEQANWKGVEYQHATAPKVALFGRGGATYSTVSFSTTHSGTAQYVVAGLDAGDYDVLRGGTPILTGQSVAAGDHTLYWESISGSFTVQAAGAPAAPGIAASGEFSVVGSATVQ